ncbi:SDR family oxidoreductase [uncultured Cellulomonas sp.]|uniref:SDR family NAD(P)-dependent oxidoreductase n=1 Tax=uncultured Cellulomonas sp. TaxID=189682 RepID=UPI002622CE94|nr:SDR family NAD(P)-dependent oxidoreductase [uncultured Cellulomonas sp.]
MDDTSTIRPLALVTGASSGIGLELAQLFARNGFDLVVCAEDAGIAVAAEGLVADGNAAVRSVRADLSTAEGVEELVREVTAAGRPLDALALNAGVANGGPFIETPLEDDLRVIGLDVVAVVHLAKRLLPAMVARGAGRVLVTSSVASLMPGPYYATYAASKAFVQSFAEAVRHELEDTGVTITTLLPGPTDTDFFEASHMEDTKVAQGPKDDPAKVAREGFEALMAGKDKVTVRSVKARAQGVLSAVLPHKAQPGAHGSMTEPQDQS